MLLPKFRILSVIALILLVIPSNSPCIISLPICNKRFFKFFKKFKPSLNLFLIEPTIPLKTPLTVLFTEFHALETVVFTLFQALDNVFFMLFIAVVTVIQIS